MLPLTFAGTQGRDERRAQPSVTFTDRMTIGSTGISVDGSVSAAATLSTTSWPPVTLPSSAYSGGSCASSAVTTKNWLPDVPAASSCVLAMATTPFVYWSDLGGASTTL